ncbi:MAG: hypothetical protein ACRC33_01535 [Gemmataceae bacterium]
MTAADKVGAAYELNQGRWSGCNWPTRFGSLGIDLDGVSAALARRIASRWSGLTSAGGPSDDQWDACGGMAASLGLPPARFAWEWGLAAAVLAAIESDARTAERQAEAAYRAARDLDWVRALRHARRAAVIESGYPAPRGWRRLLRAVRRAAEQGGG